MRAVLVSCVALVFAIAVGGAGAAHYHDVSAAALGPATHSPEGAMTPSVLRLGVTLPTVAAAPATAQEPAATSSEIPTLWRDLIIAAVAVAAAVVVGGVVVYGVNQMHHHRPGGGRVGPAH